MMTLKEVKDWMKDNLQCDVDYWKIGSYVNKDKTICVKNLTSNRNKLAIGGLKNTSTRTKGISIVIHWDKNPDESERVAQDIHALFYGQRPVIESYQDVSGQKVVIKKHHVVTCQMRSDEPISLGTDSEGVYEYVVEMWMTYQTKKVERESEE